MYLQKSFPGSLSLIFDTVLLLCNILFSLCFHDNIFLRFIFWLNGSCFVVFFLLVDCFFYFTDLRSSYPFQLSAGFCLFYLICSHNFSCSFVPMYLRKSTYIPLPNPNARNCQCYFCLNTKYYHKI